MDEYFVTNFLQGYFRGIDTIEFFVMREKRQILIHFKNEEVWKDNMTKEKLQGTVDLYLLDKQNLDVMVDRDKLETVMFLTATQGAIGAVIAEYVNKNKPDPEDFIDSEEKEANE
jgi:hypothetical protein